MNESRIKIIYRDQRPPYK